MSKNIALTDTDSFGTTIRSKVVDLLKLSGPIVLSRVGFLTLSFVDILMVGHYLTTSLAAISITHAIADTFMLIAAGMLYGVLVKTSMTAGEDSPEEAGHAVKRGVVYGFFLSIGAVMASLAIIPLLGVMGFEAGLAQAIQTLLFIVCIGLPAIVIHINYTFFLEGLARPTPATLFIFAGNILNVFLNYSLVFGKFGFPEMGAEGSAWSTTIVRVFLAVGLAFYVHFLMQGRKKYKLNSQFSWSWGSWKDQRQIGYGCGLSFGLESVAFMLLALIAGLISPVVASATAVLVNIRSLLFMLPMGIGFATSIQVSMANGAKDLKDLNFSTWVGTFLGVGLTALVSISFMFWPQELINLYSDDPELITLCLPVIIYLAIAMPLDAWQGVMCNALRGREDAAMPTLYHAIAFVCVMIPAAWWLGLKQNGGVIGIFEAVVVANFIACILFTHRHFQLNAKWP